ncbi:phospholipase D-like domain-containing protein [Hyalangium gracile]|uniref:phospholipase D-like domain-containing protein n=1 Tax=Hyalangium gracile TaxID=394092 RepID=UPI001CCEB7F9|nr:phospholipase D-like domain-containing protein [Hyalangium gracile]
MRALLLGVLGASLLAACEPSPLDASAEPLPETTRSAQETMAPPISSGLTRGRYRIQVKTPSGGIGTVAAWAAHQGVVNGGNPLKLHLGPYESCAPNDCDFILTPVPGKVDTFRLEIATPPGERGVVAAWDAHKGLKNGETSLVLFKGPSWQCAPNDCEFIVTPALGKPTNTFKIEVMTPSGQRGVVAAWDAHSNLQEGLNPLKIHTGGYNTCAPNDCDFIVTPIEAPDLASLYTILKAYPGDGITYSAPAPAQLSDSFLLQTPNAWGKKDKEIPFYPAVWSSSQNSVQGFELPVCQSDNDCASAEGYVPVGACQRPSFLEDLPGTTPTTKVCMGQSDVMVDRFYQLMIQAKQRLDITTLYTPPDRRFLAAVQRALHFLAKSGREVEVRVLVGIFPPATLIPANQVVDYLGTLTTDMGSVSDHKVRVSLGYMKSCSAESIGYCPITEGLLWGNSWNHSKIVAVDGRRVMVGGHNFFTNDYLLWAPVHDLSMELESSAARTAHFYADELWKFTCDYEHIPPSAGLNVFAYWTGYPIGRNVERGCLLPPRPVPPPQDVPSPNATVMPLGRMGYGIYPLWSSILQASSDIAREVALSSAKKTLRISQQDLGVRPPLPLPYLYPVQFTEPVFAAMIDLITLKGGDVYVVLSDPNHASYTTHTSIAEVMDHFMSVAKERTGLSEAELKPMLCKQLHLTTVRFNREVDHYNWSFQPIIEPQSAVGNHAKFWMVDDTYFYIGSHNLYPVNLQEYGYLVQGAGPVKTVLETYWTPLWTNSSAGAVSGPEATHCYYQ